MVHYIAAPGFDSKDQLAVHPEFVDLLAMNQTLMERWNRIVDPSVDGTPAGIRLI